MIENLLTLAAVILLPIVPACILYKLFPAKTIVKGPFKGLNINLTGAFGGYFLVLLIAVGFIQIEGPSQTYDIWKVEGTIKFGDDSGSMQNLKFLLEPSTITTEPNGTFKMNIMTVPDYSNGKELPWLLLDHNGYRTETVKLEQYRKNAVDNKIVIEKPIVLKREPRSAYNPSEVSLQPMREN